MAATDARAARRGWGWVAHLRAGGHTPWAVWAGEGEPTGPVLPGAQQLEVLRRLNSVGRPSPALVERVLVASAVGRGRPDLELTGGGESPYGPRPVDPASLPAEELLRVVVGLVAEDVAAVGVPEAPAPRPRPWRRRYRLVGDPWLAAPVRAHLVARGRPPGGRGATVLVLGTDLATMVRDAWTDRAFTDGGPPWPEWLDDAVSRRRVPPRVDLVQAARTWGATAGRRRVRIVLDHDGLPRLVGQRRLPAPPPLSADATDLARRVAAVMGLFAAPADRVELLRGVLLPRLLVADQGADRLPLAVPARLHDWVEEQAVRMRNALLAGGYAVVGEPDALLPRFGDGVAEPSQAGVLDLALRLLIADDRTEEGRA